MISAPLAEALVGIRQEFPTTSVLMDQLPGDAALARAGAGELDACLHRLLTLTSTGSLGNREPFEIFDLLDSEGWLGWDIPAVRAISRWADSWWATALALDPRVDEGAPWADEVLGHLVHLRLPLVRFVHPWLDELDGPGAVHLAELIVQGPHGSGWDDEPDALAQVLGWAATEQVVFGLTNVGGVHLDEGTLSQVLDRLLESPGSFR